MSVEAIYRVFGERLRQERERLGWTQEELGEKAGLHPSYIGQIERVEKRVSLATLERLARAIGIKPGALIDDSRPETSYDSRWEHRIGGLLRDKSSSEKSFLYSTLKHIARNIPKKKSS